MSAPSGSDAVPYSSFSEREMELGIENNALRKTLEAARAGWKAEVKALRDGRRERMVGRVLASIVAVHVARWLEQGHEPSVEEQATAVKGWTTWARAVADAAIADMEAAQPLAR